VARWVAICAAATFVAFFITIVIIADRGEGSRWWGFIDRLPYGDKIGHLCLVSTLALLCNLAIPQWSQRRIAGVITLTSLIVLTALSLEEISQAFIPGRTCDWLDWLADLAGLAIGQSLALQLRHAPFR
jgi:VanZ family protein